MRAINVDEGFLPLFTPDFRERYGAESPFVYAASDLLTAAVVDVMRKKKILVSEDTVAWFGSEEAEEALYSLVASTDGMIVLYQECVGVIGLGSFPTLVDEKLGGGAFDRWLDAFQAGRYAESEEIGRLPS